MLIRISLLFINIYCLSVMLSQDLSAVESVDRERYEKLKREENKRERIAVTKIEAMERELNRIRNLAPEERQRQELRMGSSLHKLAKEVAASRQVNKVLFWVANWELHHGSTERAHAFLDSIASNEFLNFRQAANLCRVQVLVKEGRLVEARRIADTLSQEIPQFEVAQQIVTFAERVGSIPPRTAGNALRGNLKDPAKERSEPWIFYIFANLDLAMDRFIITEFIEELSHESYLGIVGCCVVTLSSDALGSLSHFDEFPQIDAQLIWANPAQPDGQAWIDDWQFPKLPSFVLLGPDRSIMSINPSINDLRTLSGREKQETKANYKSKNNQAKGKSRIKWR